MYSLDYDNDQVRVMDWSLEPLLLTIDGVRIGICGSPIVLKQFQHLQRIRQGIQRRIDLGRPTPKHSDSLVALGGQSSPEFVDAARDGHTLLQGASASLTRRRYVCGILRKVQQLG